MTSNNKHTSVIQLSTLTGAGAVAAASVKKSSESCCFELALLTTLAGFALDDAGFEAVVAAVVVVAAEAAAAVAARYQVLSTYLDVRNDLTLWSSVSSVGVVALCALNLLMNCAFTHWLPCSSIWAISSLLKLDAVTFFARCPNSRLRDKFGVD